ncbi:MAG: molybdate ABC transporter substrate-binding protein [Acetatifactor sp.]|nr:molybdate ABC transporter substrate-binding protein [Acetatifactor sp.]MDE7112598.1 molybdate ABC transporter substrate-binding protein [Acetatifactor sp.]
MKKQNIRVFLRVALLMAVMLTMFTIVGCGKPAGGSQAEPVELTVLAAASLTDVCNEIGERYEAEHENVKLNFSYGSSGALQTQIEEGAPADIFMSAAMKQMTALDEEGLMDSDSIIQLLENKIVLVVPAGSDTDLSSFEEVVTDKVSMIGLGEPESVPVGQYSEEVFTTLNLLDAVKAKANYGSDVRTVLSWVETGEVDCGIVYATDAYTTEQVKIVAEAPEGSCKRVIYPAGVVKNSAHTEEAAAFVEYLQTEEILALFESYGFSRME